MYACISIIKEYHVAYTFAYICTHFPSQKPRRSKGHTGEGKSFHDSHYDI